MLIKCNDIVLHTFYTDQTQISRQISITKNIFQNLKVFIYICRSSSQEKEVSEVSGLFIFFM